MLLKPCSPAKLFSCRREHGTQPSRRQLCCRVTASQDSAGHKRAAAQLLVDKYVTSNQVLGLGSGELVSLVIEEVGKRIAAGSLQGVVSMPASDAAAHQSAFHGVPVTSLAKHDRVDLLVEEVDQMDVAKRAFIKGIKSEPQQPQIPRLRNMLAISKQLVVLANSKDTVTRLGGTLPVVIEAEKWEEPAEELDDIFLGDAELWRRPTTGTANPRGGDFPYVSPEGHNIVDVRFYEGLKLFGEDANYSRIADEILAVDGVVTCGLFLDAAVAAVIAHEDKEPEFVDFK